MHIKKHVFAYLGVCLITALALLFSNDIMAAIHNGDNQLRAVSEPDRYTKNEVRLYLYTARGYNDIYESIKVSALACCLPASGENTDCSQREVYIQLRGSKRTYEIKANVVAPHPGVFTITDDRRQSEANQDKAYLSASFSTLGLPKGEYDMYFVVKENDTVYGTAPVGRHFVKYDFEIREE